MLAASSRQRRVVQRRRSGRAAWLTEVAANIATISTRGKMEQLRKRLSIYILGLILSAAYAFAQSTLTQIEDTVYTPSNSLFNGTVVITWTGTGTPTSGSPAPTNTSVKIYNGALSVLLVPSTTITPAAYYQAVFSSSDGTVSWTQTWQVPPSSTPLTLSQVEVPFGTST